MKKHNEIANLIRRVLLQIGEDPDREGLRETPQRFTEMI
ncbi:MAG: GTP cyclohydrolase I, partial [Armatimonadetes bacterium]|nr:GTP cyclohydrolase I [Armatimonadota bacterium]